MPWSLDVAAGHRLAVRGVEELAEAVLGAPGEGGKVE